MATINPLQKKNAAAVTPPVQAIKDTMTPPVIALPSSPPPPGSTQRATRSVGSGPLAPPNAVPTTKPMPVPTTSATGSVGQNAYTPVGDEGTIMQNYLNQFLGADNALMRDARTRGLEQAGQMGLQNSSIAAGASQRAALEQVVPLAGQAFDLFGQREQRNWQTGERLGQQDWTSGENLLDRNWRTGERVGQQQWTSGENVLDRRQQTQLQQNQQQWTSGENVLDRNQQTNLQQNQQQWQTGERVGSQEWQRRQDQRQREWTSSENRLDRDQQITMTQLQDWANNQSFMREFNANLSMLPIQNATQLMNAITQQALDNPEVYTPDIVSGLTEFFTTNYLDVLSRYFPNLYAAQGG